MYVCMCGVQTFHRMRDSVHAYVCCTVLYCTVLYCTVLYCTVLYCTVLYCIALYCTVLHNTILFCTVLYGTWSWIAWACISWRPFSLRVGSVGPDGKMGGSRSVWPIGGRGGGEERGVVRVGQIGCVVLRCVG